MTERFGLYQLNGEILPTRQWDGNPLTTVQMQVRWRLIEKLTWQDGRAVSAFDSAFAFEVAQASQLPELKHLTERTASYQAIDERTIEWVSLAGFIDKTYFLNLLTPLPRHLYEGLSASQVTTSTQIKRKPLSYGAYKIEDWTKGKDITLSPNDFYVRGKPPLERLTFRFILDPNELLNKLTAGECDVATHNPAFEEVYERIQSLVEEGRLKMQKVPALIFEHLDFNLQPVAGYNGAASTLLDHRGSPLLQHLQFRRAVATCLNRRTLVQESTHDSGFIRHSYMSSSHLFYPGDQALTFYPFNPMSGRAMIEQLGYQDTNGDGILEDQAGNKLSLHYSIRTTPQRELIAQRVAEQLRLYCGIETIIEPYNAEFFDDGPEGPIFGRQYDIAQFSWLSSIEPPCYLYMTSEIPTALNHWRSTNNTGFSNPEFDDACQTALQSLDEEQKAANHAKALAIFTEQLPSIPLLTRAKIILFRPEIEGVLLDATANSELWNIENFDVQ
jgi:peptide/nickel transport system substrate-binding protein